MKTTTAHPKLSAMTMVHGPKQDASRTSPDLAHTIAPFAIAIVAAELYRASYVDTPPAQMIWKKQKVGSVNKRENMRTKRRETFKTINSKKCDYLKQNKLELI